jgi:hypothetical protein
MIEGFTVQGKEYNFNDNDRPLSGASSNRRSGSPGYEMIVNQ